MKVKRRASKLFSMLLALALFITMMPFGVAAVFAEGETEQAAALTVTGDALASTLSYDSIKTLKNDEGIKAQTLDDVVFHTLNSSDTAEDFKVSGVTLESLINLAGIKDGAAIGTITVTADDGYAATLTPEQVLENDIQGNKAMFIWLENDSKVQKVAVGQFSADDQNKGKWVKNAISISVDTKKADPQPQTAVLALSGNGLVKELSFESVKTLKNDEAIKAVKKEDVVFHTKNKKGTEADSKVTGVTIEDLINIAGIKDRVVIDSVTATASDGYAVTYTADEIFKKDLQGNKAMFVWECDGEKVQMTAIGQFAEGEANKAKWAAGDAFVLSVKTKTVSKPGKPKVTLKTGKKKATVSWKKVSGAEGYVVYRSTKKNKGFKSVKTIRKGTTVKFVNKKLKGGKTYYFKVKAFKTDANGNRIFGSYSSVKKVKIKK